MRNEDETNDAARERMSALLDGELERDSVLLACSHYRGNAESRATWHAYHLIGDVLRSDDLASHPGRDASFLAALRVRLDEMPVVLAPEVSVEPAAGRPQVSRHRPWLTPAAVAAGFVAVAGVLTLGRPGFFPDNAAGSERLARNTTPVIAPADHVTSASISVPVAAEPQVLVANGQLIRDARLDRYLAAHQQFAGSSALGVPSAYLRNATTEMPGR